MALSQTTVLKVYNAVIEDVIAGVRDCFLDDGVDEQVLQELKQLWEAKLMASKAIEVNSDSDLHPPPIVANNQKANGNKSAVKKNAVHQNHDSHTTVLQTNSNTNHLNASNSTHANSNTTHSNAIPNQTNHSVTTIDPSNKVPIQLTLPAQAGVPGSQPKVFTIQIPASALQGNQLHRILSGPFIATTLQLPQPLAATLLQQHITSQLLGNNNTSSDSGGGDGTGINKSLAPYQLDGACDIDMHETNSSCSKSNLGCSTSQGATTSKGGSSIAQRRRRGWALDGGLDSSEEDGEGEPDADGDGDGDGSDAPEDEEEEAEEEEEEGASGDDGDGGPDDEPLNSGDDVSEEDPQELFDTDNVVVCQYDKITRSRNKWKFYLKDGIMNLSGKDFVFQKATGDAEW